MDDLEPLRTVMTATARLMAKRQEAMASTRAEIWQIWPWAKPTAEEWEPGAGSWAKDLRQGPGTRTRAKEQGQGPGLRQCGANETI